MRQLTPFALALLVAITAAGCNTGASTPPSMVAPTVAKYTTMPSSEELLSEKVTGNASAPNTIYEYVSFSCGGCANFHATLEPQIKSQFVDTGKASLVFRNLFLSSETETAAMLARCVGNANFFSAVDYIYTNQARWVTNGDDGIKSLMLGFGMSQSLIDSCLANNTLGTALAQIHTTALAQTYQLPDGTTASGFTHVPAIVVNGVKLDSTVNADGTVTNAPTIDNIAKYIK